MQGLILNSSPIWLFRSLCSLSGDGVVSKWCEVSWVKLSYVSQLKCNFRVRLTSLQISSWSILPLSGSVLSPSHSLSQKQSLKPISSCTTCWETHWTAQENGSGFRYFPLLFSKFWSIFHCLNMPLLLFKAFKNSQSCQHVCLKHPTPAWRHSKMSMDDFKLQHAPSLPQVYFPVQELCTGRSTYL